MRPPAQPLLHDSLIGSAQTVPRRDAVVDEYGPRTYEELADESLRFAKLLQDEGLQPGDRVALYLDNTARCAAGIIGTLIAGGVFVGVNPQTKAEKLAPKFANYFFLHGHALMEQAQKGPVGWGDAKAPLEEAVKLANDSSYGLSAYVFTRSKAKADEIANQLIAGTVMHNDTLYTHAAPETPWARRNSRRTMCSGWW